MWTGDFLRLGIVKYDGSALITRMFLNYFAVCKVAVY